ncbi:chromate efflux transporter [Thalassospira sp. MA62]|nr:chromate efflux transporter [Thalassospira sp. MA62]
MSEPTPSLFPLAPEPHGSAAPKPPVSFLSIFLIFLRLGLTSFGGPVAHIGYFREEFVMRRKWLSDARFADLVALCQFAPGPASSQVGMGIGLLAGGIRGSLIAWFGFTMPSAIVLAVLGMVFGGGDLAGMENVIHGLKLVAVGVVIHALIGMARNLCPDVTRAIFAVVAAIIMILVDAIWAQIAVILAGMVAGYFLLKADEASQTEPPIQNGPVWFRWLAGLALLIFLGLLIVLPVLAQLDPTGTMAVIDGFYRSGALVFGGGHVVLPLLEGAVVDPGWVNSDSFLAGYGATQAVPGPIFTFAAYLGAVLHDVSGPSGYAISALTACVTLVSIFLPAWLLVVGLVPFWDRVRHVPAMQAGLMGVNAAVVGLLGAVLYDPILISAISDGVDVVCVLAVLGALQWRVMPVWALVGIGALAGYGAGLL